jgi:hypothetical protein
MQEPQGFESFVTARGDALHHTAYLLTGDHDRAEELLLDALSRAWPKWVRIAANPEPFVRQAIADEVAPRWQRGTSREPAAELAVDGENLPELAEREGRPAAAPEVRVAAVRRLVVSRRRFRRQVGAGVLVAALVAGVVVSVEALQPQPHRAARAVDPVKVDSARPVTLPTYFNGGRLINATQVDLSRVGDTSYLITPTRYGLDFAFRCPLLMSGSALFEIRIKGYLMLGSTCIGSDPGGGIGGRQVVAIDGAAGVSGGGDPTMTTFWKALHVELGRPTPVVVTVTTAAFAATPPPMMTVGVYQDVPFADYPLPQRPNRVLPPNEIGLDLAHPQPVVTPGGTADGSWTVQLPYRRDLVVGGAITAPGQVRVRLNGALVGGADSWNYDGFSSLEVPLGPSLPAGVRLPRAGQLVTITVTMSGFAAPDWKFELGQFDP